MRIGSIFNFFVKLAIKIDFCSTPMHTIILKAVGLFMDLFSVFGGMGGAQLFSVDDSRW